MLYCQHNNIKYLSSNNCEVIKELNAYGGDYDDWNTEFNVLDNPFSADFSSNEDFKEYLLAI